MANVCVTGSAGFIGSWITKALVEQGHYVVGVDDLSGGSIENLASVAHKTNFRLAEFNLSDPYHTNILFRDGKFDVVYHLAANAREGASFFQPVSVVRRNTMAYTTVLMNFIKYGCKRMILFSSIAVLGRQKPPFTEDMPRHPVDIYGLQKANMEQMTEMMAECHGFEYVIFRPHNVYGEFQALNDPFRNVFGIWMNKIMRDEPIQIYGDGMQKRAFSYIGDSLPCYIEAMNNNSANFIVNIGSESPHTVKDAALITCGAMEKAVAIEHLPHRYGEVKEAYMEQKLAKEIYDFADTTDLGTGLLRMAKWAKKQGPQKWRTGDPIELPQSKYLPENWRGK